MTSNKAVQAVIKSFAVMTVSVFYRAGLFSVFVLSIWLKSTVVLFLDLIWVFCVVCFFLKILSAKILGELQRFFFPVPRESQVIKVYMYLQFCRCRRFPCPRCCVIVFQTVPFVWLVNPNQPRPTNLSVTFALSLTRPCRCSCHQLDTGFVPAENVERVMISFSLQFGWAFCRTELNSNGYSKNTNVRNKSAHTVPNF